MKRIVLIAALAAATPALAGGIGDIIRGKKKEQPQQTQPQQTQPSNRGPMGNILGQAQQGGDAAKAAFDVALVEMQAGKLYLAGLADLAQKPGTWDRGHTVHLFNEAQRAVIRAEQQLDAVETLASAKGGNALDQVKRARSSLVESEGQLRSFAEPIRGGAHQPQTAQTIKNLWQSVDKAQKDVEGAAGALGIETKLKGL